MTTTATSVRMDEGLKQQVSRTLEQLGLSFNTFVVMASKQLVLQNRLPFEVKAPASRAYIEELAKEYGLLPDDAEDLTDDKLDQWRAVYQ